MAAEYQIVKLKTLDTRFSYEFHAWFFGLITSPVQSGDPSDYLVFKVWCFAIQLWAARYNGSNRVGLIENWRQLILAQGHENMCKPLQWCHNERDRVSDHQPQDCSFHRLFRRRSKKTSKLCVPVSLWGEFTRRRWIPTQRVSNAENVSIWWRHHA